MSKRKIFLILFLIIFLLLSGLTIYFLKKSKITNNYQNKGKSESTNQDRGIRNHSFFGQKITPTPAWLIFVHPKLKYEMKYPSNWKKDSWDIQEAVNVQGTADGNIWSHVRLIGNNKRLEILAWGNRAKTPIREWLRWYRHEDLNLNDLPKDPNFIFLGETSVRMFQEKTSFTYPVVRIFFQKEDKLFEILYRMDDLIDVTSPNETQLVDEPYTSMLQSFKFTP